MEDDSKSDPLKGLENLFQAAREERDRLEMPEGLRAAVLERLDDRAADASAVCLAEDGLEGFEEVLIESHARELSEVDWSAFRAGVMEGLVVRSELTVAELLREERTMELERLDGSWTAFSAQLDKRLNEATRLRVAPRASPQLLPSWIEAWFRPRRSEGLDPEAIDFLRTDVEDEVRDMAPAFEERFGAEVERKIEVRGARAESLGERLWAQIQKLGVLPRTGVGFGLAAAAAALVVVMTNSPAGDPEKILLSGQVSVDSMSFEGDVMMIPSEGVTVVVLSGV